MSALNQILLLEVSELYDVDTWNTILETLVSAMLKTENLEQMDSTVRLAVAIAVVGAHRTEFFEAVFGIIIDWQNSKGCWWVIQEELVRHYYLGGFYDGLPAEHSSSTPNDARCQALLVMRDQLKKITSLSNSIAHPVLHKRLAILKHDLHSLLDRMKFSPDMQQPLDSYTAQYPLHKFSAWFISWAQEKIKTVTLCSPSQSLTSVSSVSPQSNPCCQVITRLPSSSKSCLQKYSSYTSKRKFSSAQSDSATENSAALSARMNRLFSQKTEDLCEDSEEKHARKRAGNDKHVSLPKLNLAKEVLSTISPHSQPPLESALHDSETSSKPVTSSDATPVTVCDAAQNAFEMLRDHRRGREHLICSSPPWHNIQYPPLSTTTVATAALSRTKDELREQKAHGHVPPHAPASFTAGSTAHTTSSTSPRKVTFRTPSPATSKKKKTKRLLSPPPPILFTKIQKKRRPNQTEVAHEVRTLDSESIEHGTEVVHRKTISKESNEQGQQGQRSALDLMFTSSTTVALPTQSSSSEASRVSRGSRNFRGDISTTCSETGMEPPKSRSRMASSLIMRMLVREPISVARALSSEVWQTFSPHSQ